MSAAKSKCRKSNEEHEKHRQQVIKNIRALLISAPSGLTVTEIQSDHQNMIGKPLPYRELGYKNPLDLIKDLPDVCRPTYERGVLVLKCIADEKTRHIASLVARQKSKKPKSRRTTVAIHKHVPKPTVPYYLRTCVKQLLTAYPGGVLGTMFCNAYNRRFGQELDYARLGFKSLGEFLRALSDIVKIEHMQGGGFRVIATSTASGRQWDIANKVKPVNASVSYSKAAAQLKNSQMTTKLPESTVVERVKDFLKTQLDDKSGVDNRLKDEIKAILMKRKNGVWAARLPVEYRNLYKKDLHVRLLGFSSVVELVGAMPEIVKIERPTKMGDWYLTLKTSQADKCNMPKRSLPEPIETLVHDTKPSEDLSVPHSGPGRPRQARIPISPPGSPRDNPVNLPDAVDKGTYYCKLKIPQTGDVELFVSHVIDPGFFWIVLIEHWPKLEALAEDLRVFYSNKEGDKYRMPEWFLSVGQVCCALYDDGAWYRALIVGIQSTLSVEVFYVDYGNTSKVNLSNLRIMRSHFAKLPAQAIQCRLANLKPHGDEWSPGAIYRLYHMTKDFKALVGLVCGSKGEVVNICLCDTTSEEDIHINDALYEEGFAEFAPDSAAVPLSPVRKTSQKNADKGEAVTEGAPGLPPPRQEQQQMNQHIAALLAQGAVGQVPHNNPQLPDFPLPIGEYGTSYFNYLQYFNDTANGPSTPVAQELQAGGSDVGSGQDSAMSAEDLEFMEEVCQELEQNSSDECLLKRIQLTEAHFMHVVNVDMKPYVISAEISAFFWDDDLLRSMLRQNKMPAAKVVLSAETNENLFQELVRCNVKGSLEGDIARSYITLYELQGIPEIVEAFDHPSKELIDRVKEEVERFSNEGQSYWIVKVSDSESTENDSESQEEIMDVEFRMEELRLMFQAMQFRRKRILQSMLTAGPGTGSTVDELNDVEAKIQMLKLEMEQKERQEQHEAAEKVNPPPTPPCISPTKPLYPVFFANPHVGMVYSGQLGRINSE